MDFLTTKDIRDLRGKLHETVTREPFKAPVYDYDADDYNEELINEVRKKTDPITRALINLAKVDNQKIKISKDLMLKAMPELAQVDVERNVKFIKKYLKALSPPEYKTRKESEYETIMHIIGVRALFSILNF